MSTRSRTDEKTKPQDIGLLIWKQCAQMMCSAVLGMFMGEVLEWRLEREKLSTGGFVGKVDRDAQAADNSLCLGKSRLSVQLESRCKVGPGQGEPGGDSQWARENH